MIKMKHKEQKIPPPQEKSSIVYPICTKKKVRKIKKKLAKGTRIFKRLLKKKRRDILSNKLGDANNLSFQGGGYIACDAFQTAQIRTRPAHFRLTTYNTCNRNISHVQQRTRRGYFHQTRRAFDITVRIAVTELRMFERNECVCRGEFSV